MERDAQHRLPRQQREAGGARSSGAVADAAISEEAPLPRGSLLYVPARQATEADGVSSIPLCDDLPELSAWALAAAEQEANRTRAKRRRVAMDIS